MESKVIDLKPTNQNLTQLDQTFFGEGEKSQDTFEFDKFLKIVLKNKYVLLFFLIVGCGVGYMLATSEIPLYRASNQIVVEPESSNRSEFLTSRLRYYVPRSYYETQQVVMSSKLVLDKAAQSLSPSTIKMMFAPVEKSWLQGFLEKSKNRIKGIIKSLDSYGIWTSNGNSEPTKTVDTSVVNLPGTNQVSDWISRSLSVSFGRTEQIQRLNVVASDPLLATIVVNAVADAYLSFLVENRLSQTERAGQWLAEKISESKNKLTSSENELKEYQLENQLLDLQTVKALSSNTLGQVNSDLLEARRNFAELSKKYGPKHPSLIEAKRILSIAQSRYGRASNTELSTKENRFELNKLERSVNSNRELYELFLSRFNEVELGIDSVSSNTSLLEKANVPRAPFKPDVEGRMVTGSILGLLLGLILVFSREFLDRTFKNQLEVEERLKFPVIGVLPLLSRKVLRKDGKAVPERYYIDQGSSGFAEVINHIRTGIIYSNFDRPPKVVLVTSAVPGEGKTTCSSNLALAFSKLGKTLLIDADFRKPRIAKISKVENIIGLTGYVAGQNSLEECLYNDADSPDLLIMRSGEIPPNPLELLSSDRFKETLELMKSKFDYIIVDSAPILPVSDGVVLGRLADAVLMVLKAGDTRHQIADAAIKRFAAANIRPTGIVLSQLNFKQSHYYDKYDYYTREYYGGGY